MDETVAAPVRPGVMVWLARLGLAVVFVGAIFGALGLGAAALFSLNYRQQIYPGVSAWGVDLSGRTPEDAAAALTGAFTYPQQPGLTFRDVDTPNGKTWTASPAQLGLRFDLAATIAAAYTVGRTGNPLVDAWQILDTWHTGRQVSPVLVYNAGQAEVYLNGIAQLVFAPTVEATLTATGSEIASSSSRAFSGARRLLS